MRNWLKVTCNLYLVCWIVLVLLSHAIRLFLKEQWQIHISQRLCYLHSAQTNPAQKIKATKKSSFQKNKTFDIAPNEFKNMNMSWYLKHYHASNNGQSCEHDIIYGRDNCCVECIQCLKHSSIVQKCSRLVTRWRKLRQTLDGW